MSPRRFADWLCFWFFLLTGSIFLVTVVSIPLFAVFAKAESLPQIAGISYGALMHNYNQLMVYLYNPFEHVLHMQDFPTSARGAVHFADVKNLFIINVIVLVITAWPACRWLKELRQKRQRYILQRPAIIGIVIPLVLLATMALNFDAFFVRFHEVLFRNSDWMFDPATDPIINVLPEDFFATCFVIGFAVFIGVLIYFVVIGRRDARRAAK
ncbi:TIGR01906 family membrane protein [Lacticaseibacillus zhaodongensis]|uniref:TIGR01906 family membrane protein n=1 Tax=Lacticaseibacillus zhaodongensis TaxID=2668065 RepID=UPI0012D2A181|nr:TIGR01906 family membrane protein [Lacticaseibacillus zhaodongensis]